MSTSMIPLMTPRQAIFHSAELLMPKQGSNKPTIQVQGQVAMWDPSLARLDMVHEGAKLIVRTTSCDEINVQVGDTVVVQGVLKKEQRRTFLEATKVVEINVEDKEN